MVLFLFCFVLFCFFVCTGQWIACFDRCQLIIAGMSNIKEVHRKLRLYVSFLEYGRHVGQLSRRRRRRRAYAPTSNTASQDHHEKINSWDSFIFPLHDEYGAPLGGPSGRRSSANNGSAVIYTIIGFLKHFKGSLYRTKKVTHLRQRPLRKMQRAVPSL